jgi:uncharacterized coiled-coil protein SlyX
MNNTSESRLDRLESHLSHIEKQVEELNGVIINQARDIKRLQTITQRLRDSVETTEVERMKSTNPKPPHYQ